MLVIKLMRKQFQILLTGILGKKYSMARQNIMLWDTTGNLDMTMDTIIMIPVKREMPEEFSR